MEEHNRFEKHERDEKAERDRLRRILVALTAEWKYLKASNQQNLAMMAMKLKEEENMRK